jgi:hypothetical protein
MIPLILAAVLAAGCPVTATITTHSYTNTTQVACAPDWQYKRGALRVEIKGDGIFKNEFERAPAAGVNP